MSEYMRDSDNLDSRRWKLYAPIEIHYNNEILTGSSKNISITGVQVETDHKLEEHTIVNVEIYFEHIELNDWSQKFIVEAEVAWIKQLSTDFITWEIGLHFTNIDKEQHAFLESEVVDLEEV